jgi:acetyl-CoA acetyltransferase
MTGIGLQRQQQLLDPARPALFLARQAVESGVVDCALALGFEQMVPGALTAQFKPPDAIRRFRSRNRRTCRPARCAARDSLFWWRRRVAHEKVRHHAGNVCARPGKASRHGANNPLALFRKEVSVDEVMDSPMIMAGVMTRLMACPPTCGAAAAILVSDAFARRRGLSTKVSIAAQAMTTDSPSTFDAHDMMQLVGYDMTRAAVAQVFDAAGIGPDDIDVVELHDCFAQNELISYEALGLCPEGGAAFAAFEALRASGAIAARETVVLFNTGTGLKYR